MKSMARLGSVLFCLIVSTLLWLSSVNPAWALTFPNLLALSKPTDPLALHFVNRLSFGPRPGDLEHIQAIGVEDYIQEQLNSDNRLNPIDLEQKLNRLPNFNLTPIALLQNYLPKSPPKTRSPQEQSQFTKQLRSVLQETITAHLLRTTESPQQLQEVMTAFWFNHFNIDGLKGRNQLFTASYENQSLRPNVFGNFRELLGATAKHPAMLFYLDNYRNQVPNPRNPKVGINENYARELLELHTLGVDGGYTQADVIALARIMTGWTMLPDKQLPNADLKGNGFYFDSKRHDFSDKIFMGHKTSV